MSFFMTFIPAIDMKNIDRGCQMKSMVLVKKEIDISNVVSLSLSNRYYAPPIEKERETRYLFLYLFFNEAHFLNTASAVYTSDVYDLCAVDTYTSHSTQKCTDYEYSPVDGKNPTLSPSILLFA